MVTVVGPRRFAGGGAVVGLFSARSPSFMLRFPFGEPLNNGIEIIGVQAVLEETTDNGQSLKGFVPLSCCLWERDNPVLVPL